MEASSLKLYPGFRTETSVLWALFDYLQVHHFRSSALSSGFPTLREFILTKHREIVNRAGVLAGCRQTNPAPRQGCRDRFADCA
jgi:hypothetical protein